MRRIGLVFVLVTSAWAAQAQNLTVTVNSGSPLAAQPTFEAAIAASGVALGDITSIEITAGDFLTADWEYLKAVRKDLTQLREFIVIEDVTSVADLPDETFSSDWPHSLERVVIHKLKNVGDASFSENFFLNEVKLPDAVSIGARAFFQTGLSAVSLPAVESVDQGAFSDCISLSFVSLPVVTSIGQNAFFECPLTKMHLGKIPPLFILSQWYNDVFGSYFGPPTGTRLLKLVDSDGQPLTGVALDEAIAAYRAVNDGDTSDNLWHGWYIGQASELMKIRINGQVAEYEGETLEEAIAASGISPNNIIQLEVNGNIMSSPDFKYMQSLTALHSFTLGVELGVLTGFYHPTLREFNGLKIKRVDSQYYDGGSISPAFAGPLVSIYLPEATGIGEYTFKGCRELTTLKLPSVRSINCWHTFTACESLNKLQLGATPPDAWGDDGAFGSCPSPRYLELVDTSGEPLTGSALSTAIAAYRASGEGDSEPDDGLWWGWTISQSRIKIKVNGQAAEYEGESIEEAIAASGIATNGVSQLELVKGDIQTADSLYMLSSLTALQHFTLSTEQSELQWMLPALRGFNGSKVKSVGDGAFKDFVSLTAVSLPTVANIDAEAFANCTSLSMLVLGAEPPTVGPDAFKNCPTPRYLWLVDADGQPLTGDALIAAQNSYLSNGRGPAQTWNGWTLMLPRTITIEANNGQVLLPKGVHAAPNAVVVNPELFEPFGTFSFTPMPNSGYYVDAVSVFETSTPSNRISVTQAGDTYSFVMPIADVTIQVRFLLRTYEVQTLASIMSGGTVSGGDTYSHGSSVAVAATPAEGYRFVRWVESDTTASTQNPFVFICSGNRSLTAEFELITYTLSYAAAEGGSISGAASQTVEHGNTGAEVEAVPNEGYVFKHWSDGVTTAKRTDSNVTAGISVSAVFERITYTLSYTAAEGGSISGAATQTVEHGSSGVEVEAVPDEGYEFKHWSDGVTTAKRTDSNVTASISVSAVFEQLKESGGSTTSLFEVLQEVLSCYPNPTDGVVWVKDMPTSVIKYEVQVYNANGLLLRRIAPQEHVLIDLSAYPAGLYIIRVGNAMAKVVRR